MVSATPLIDLGGAAEFAGDKNRGGFQKSFGFQCAEQSGQAVIQIWQVGVLESGEIIAVCVPASKLDRNQADAGFDQAGGQQATLRKRTLTEHAANRIRLFG